MVRILPFFFNVSIYSLQRGWVGWAVRWDGRWQKPPVGVSLKQPLCTHTHALLVGHTAVTLGPHHPIGSLH